MIYSSKTLNSNLNQDHFDFHLNNIEIKILINSLWWFVPDVSISITLYGID